MSDHDYVAPPQSNKQGNSTSSQTEAYVQPNTNHPSRIKQIGNFLIKHLIFWMVLLFLIKYTGIGRNLLTDLVYQLLLWLLEQ